MMVTRMRALIKPARQHSERMRCDTGGRFPLSRYSASEASARKPTVSRRKDRTAGDAPSRSGKLIRMCSTLHTTLHTTSPRWSVQLELDGEMLLTAATFHCASVSGGKDLRSLTEKTHVRLVVRPVRHAAACTLLVPVCQSG